MHVGKNEAYKNIPEEDQSADFHYIIPLTSSEEHDTKSKKTLEGYLRNIGCCKKLVG